MCVSGDVSKQKLQNPMHIFNRKPKNTYQTISISLHHSSLHHWKMGLAVHVYVHIDFDVCCNERGICADSIYSQIPYTNEISPIVILIEFRILFVSNKI